jgi:hypothetical protein
LILEVVADADGQRFRGERAYRRVITDAAGAAITKEHVAFINGAKVSSDTRLAPDESRTETFTFPIKRAIPARVRVTFWYYYSPMAQLESQKRVTFLTLSQMLP